jgi:anti-sigma B factor antagonist
MPDSPIVSVEELAELVVLHVLADRLDEEQLRRLQTEVRAAAEAHAGQSCVLDLAQVHFLPSMSLAALIRMHAEFQGRHQRFALAGLQSHVRDLFVMTRLDRLFEIYDDVAAAQKAVGAA